MLEKLEISPGASIKESKSNAATSFFAVFFCFIIFFFLALWDFSFAAMFVSVGITGYALIGFYELLNFSKKKGLKLFGYAMYFLVFLSFLIIFGQFSDISSQVKEKTGIELIFSPILGIAVLIIPRIIWSDAKSLFSKFFITLPFGLESLESIFSRIPIVLSELSRLQTIIPAVLKQLYNFAVSLGLTNIQANIFVFVIIAGAFYSVIKILETIVKWILLILIFGLLLSTIVGLI